MKRCRIEFSCCCCWWWWWRHRRHVITRHFLLLLLCPRLFRFVIRNDDGFAQDPFAVHFLERPRRFLGFAEADEAESLGLLRLRVLHHTRRNDLAVFAKVAEQIRTLYVQIEILDVKVGKVHRCCFRHGSLLLLLGLFYGSVSDLSIYLGHELSIYLF